MVAVTADTCRCAGRICSLGGYCFSYLRENEQNMYNTVHSVKVSGRVEGWTCIEKASSTSNVTEALEKIINMIFKEIATV